MRYFDASALVKRYVLEPGSDRVRRLLGDEPAATSRFTVVEIASAVARRCREGDLSPGERDGVIAALEADARGLLFVEFTGAVVTRALELLARHPLRSGDSVQLASALHLAARTGVPLSFVGFDERLNRAARSEGLAVLPPRGGQGVE